MPYFIFIYIYVYEANNELVCPFKHACTAVCRITQLTEGNCDREKSTPYIVI